jgi:putative oxidoreductase
MKSLMNWMISRPRIHKSDTAEATGLLVLRLGIGLMMAFGHGWGKLTSFGELSTKFPDPLGVGSAMSLGLTVFSEFFCALAITFGLFTRGTVIPLIVTMLVAAFVIHGDDPWGKKELALMYLVPLLALLFTGPGKYSLDRFLGRQSGIKA